VADSLSVKKMRAEKIIGKRILKDRMATDDDLKTVADTEGRERKRKKETRSNSLIISEANYDSRN
jgi:hypothetical protein